MLWKGVKFCKNTQTCCRFREMFKNINIHLKKEEIIQCFRNISVAQVLGKVESDQSDILKRAANIGLIIDQKQGGYLTRMHGITGKSKDVEGLHFVFSPVDEEIGVYLRYKDHIDLVFKMSESGAI